jgi:hypothetical protein
MAKANCPPELSTPPTKKPRRCRSSITVEPPREPASLKITNGTACEQRIAEVLLSRDGRSGFRDEIEATLIGEGHAESTVRRSMAKMTSAGNLVMVKGFRLIHADLPSNKTKRSRPGDEPQRWRSNDDAATREMNAEYVRTYLADRIDDVFAEPNAYLRKVLTAVELAGKIADAASRGDASALRERLEEYREFWIDTEDNEHLHGLTANRLMEALQVGLFPESFADDPEVVERIEAVRKEVAKRRAKEIEEHNRKYAAYEKVVAENAERAARGEPPLPVFDLGPRRRYQRSKSEGEDATQGLVPLGGGERVGNMRLEAFVKTVGAGLPEKGESRADEE